MAAFIVDWFQHPALLGEIHALGLFDNGTEYVKTLIRVVFPDYFYLLLSNEPEGKTLESLKHQLRGSGATFALRKVRTLFGYQPTAEIPALFVRCDDASSVLKNKAIKSLGGSAEEVHIVSRSRKMTALRRMPQCCWVSLAGSRIISNDSEEKIGKDHILEYKFDDWLSFSALPLDRKEHFAPPPGFLLKTLSFDIEVFKPSSRGGGMPNSSEPSNVVLCISYVVDNASSDSVSTTRREHWFLTFSDIQPNPALLPEGTKVKMYSSEKAMIYDFFEDIAKIDPILIMGFNTQSWDFRYLNERMTKIHKMKYPLSLGIYRTPVPVKMKHSMWSSDAFKYNDIAYPDIPGILCLDLHKFFVRTRPKLKKHSLDYISRTYLGVGKYDISQDNMVHAYESKDPHELSLLAQYNIHDSVLVADLFFKQKIFEEAAIEALACDTLIDDLYTKGMTIRAVNQIYRYAKEDGYVVTPVHAPDVADGTLIGAYVTDPVPGLYDNTAVYDVQSMYPSITIMLNLCYSTYIRPDQLQYFKKDDYITLPWETKGAVGGGVERHEVHFVTDKLRLGTCKRMLSDQIALRHTIKSWTVADQGSEEQRAIMKMIQKAVKMSSNSLIGLMAAPSKMSKLLSFHACAGAIYTRSREIITQVVRTVGATKNVVYSDTDSLMVANMSLAEERQELAEWLNKEYAPLIFELENVGRLLLLAAKNYIFRTEDSGETKYVGVSLSKKTTSNFIASISKEVVEMIMSRTSKKKILDYVEHRIKELPEEDPNDLAMTVTVSTVPNSIGGKLARREIAAGRVLMAGDTIDYIVLKGTKKSQPIGDRVVTVEDFFKGAAGDRSIDYDYYSSHLMSNVQKLLVYD